MYQIALRHEWRWRRRRRLRLWVWQFWRLSDLVIMIVVGVVGIIVGFCKFDKLFRESIKCMGLGSEETPTLHSNFLLYDTLSWIEENVCVISVKCIMQRSIILFVVIKSLDFWHNKKVWFQVYLIIVYHLRNSTNAQRMIYCQEKQWYLPLYEGHNSSLEVVQKQQRHLEFVF